jgi:short-subunit dehydrogenase
MMPGTKSIILTGASRGIGLAIARFLLKEGHKMFLVARSEEPLQKLKEESKEQVEFLAADLSDFEVGCPFHNRCCIVVGLFNRCHI